MMYPKSKEKALSDALFKNPTAEYRGAPFWAWNTKLSKEMLLEQFECIEQMGFGGAHMHARTGLDTPYLGEEFMSCVKAVVDKAKEDGCRAYLYDEDRWPSGSAGGMVTKEEKYRSQHLLFTPFPYTGQGFQAENVSAAHGSRSENGRLLAAYDIVLDENGCLATYKQIKKGEQPKGWVWYAYLERATPSPWYNNQTYVNTLDKAAMDRFIEITYETYKNKVGEDFGETVPSIFTDEPQFSHKSTFCFPEDVRDITLPWTEDLTETFAEAYGEDLIAGLPELFWEKPNGEVSTVRYHYHDHITERFTQAFADNCGAWCRENGIMLTGHMMEEPTLRSQTAALGEAMRAYRGFEFPGIDMLCDSHEYTTAKQAQSASHQFGREGVMSELYGVTSWSFDFRRHKLQGDWQAALGVTLRVPHLSWVSMKGEAKRDYPASINYQVPWCREYKLVEDHFARVNTAMTRGKAKVKVAVVHPIESYWLHWGPSSQTSLAREQLEDNFRNVTEWLLFGGIDFDYIDESLFPSLCEKAANPLQVGEMSYDAVIVPGCETLRSSTVERLAQFAKQGGHLIIMGDAPKYQDAVLSDAGKELAKDAQVITFSRSALMDAVEGERLVSMKFMDGVMTGHLLYQMREDNGCNWLFIAAGRPMGDPDFVRRDGVRISIKGLYRAEEYNTLTGEIRELAATWKNGRTCLERVFHNQDSLLLKLIPASEAPVLAPLSDRVLESPVRVARRVPVTLSEPNVLMLDRAQFALDDEAYRPEQELLRADNVLRADLGLPRREGEIAQPWTLPKETFTHKARLRFAVTSEVEVSDVSLALEDSELAEIYVNGQKIDAKPEGYYTDKCIGTVKLGTIPKGDNVLEVILPFGESIGFEWCYLLGDFGVRVEGDHGVIIPPVRELDFGDVVSQGLPFYGGNITYHLPVELKKPGCRIHIPRYRGALLGIEVDGVRRGEIAFAPYDVDLEDFQKGTIDIVLFGSRVNTFGAVHMVGEGDRFLNPGCWRSVNDGWSEEYVLQQVGVLSDPEVLPYK